MRIRIIITIFLTQLGLCLIAQSNVGSNIDADLSLTSNLQVYALSSFDERNTSAIGTPFLFDDWQYARVKLQKNESFTKEKFLINYDIEAHDFLVKTSQDILSLPISQVDKISLEGKGQSDELFVVIDQKDIYKVLVEGQTNLYSRMNLKYIKANYNVALDTGNIRPKYVKDASYFISRNGKLYEIPTRRKSLKISLSDISDVADYLDKQKIDLNDEVELISAILKLNNKI